MERLTLTANKFIVIDPCYVMLEEAYDKLCEKINFDLKAQIIEIDGHQLAITTTYWGDGQYNSNGKPVFSVDAGVIAAVPLELCDPEKLENFTDDEDCKYFEGEIEFRECSGTIIINDFAIYTNESDDEDDDYLEDDGPYSEDDYL